MNNVQHGVNQTFWTAAAGVLKDVVWEQFIAVAIVLTVVRLISLLMKRDTSWISSCALAICGSFFLWPHIFNLYLSMIDSEDFGSPLASLRPGHFSNPLQFMQRELILRPAFFNGPSIFLALLVVLIWAMTKRGNRRIRWLGAFGLVMILPLAWYAECFNTGPDQGPLSSPIFVPGKVLKPQINADVMGPRRTALPSTSLFATRVSLHPAYLRSFVVSSFLVCSET